MTPFKNPLCKIVTFTSALFMFSSILSTQALAEGSGASATARATAWIVSALAVDQVNDLAFGEIAPGQEQGNVTVSPNGDVTVSGWVNHLGGATAAQFTVQGEGQRTVSISLPDSAILTSGDNSMQVTGFTSNTGAQAQLANDGGLDIDVGATLAVAANQPSGEYVGTFDITVSYN